MQGATECLSAAKAEVKKNLVREYLTLLQVSTPLAHEPWPNFNHGLLDLAPFVTVLFFPTSGDPDTPPSLCLLPFLSPKPFCLPSIVTLGPPLSVLQFWSEGRNENKGSIHQSWILPALVLNT